jgi:hypothetical protein
MGWLAQASTRETLSNAASWTATLQSGGWLCNASPWQCMSLPPLLTALDLSLHVCSALLYSTRRHHTTPAALSPAASTLHRVAYVQFILASPAQQANHSCQSTVCKHRIVIHGSTDQAKRISKARRTAGTYRVPRLARRAARTQAWLPNSTAAIMWVKLCPLQCWPSIHLVNPSTADRRLTLIEPVHGGLASGGQQGNSTSDNSNMTLSKLTLPVSLPALSRFPII